MWQKRALGKINNELFKQHTKDFYDELYKKPKEEWNTTLTHWQILDALKSKYIKGTQYFLESKLKMHELKDAIDDLVQSKVLN